MFYGVRRATGEPAWQFDGKPDGALGFHGNPTIIGKLAVVHSDGPAPAIYAFDQADGTLMWSYSAGPANFSFDVLPVPPNVIALASHGLVALDARSGKKVWELAVAPAAFISPATDGKRVFAADADGTLLAVDAATGKPLWKTPLKGKPSSSVAVADGAVFVAMSETPWDDPWSTASPGMHILYRLDAARGTVEASTALPAKGLGQAIRSKDVVVVYAGNVLLGLTADLKKVLWKQQLVHNSKTPRLQLLDGILLAANDPKQIVAVRAASGELMWRQTLPASATTLRADGENIYVGIAGGVLISFHLPTGR